MKTSLCPECDAVFVPQRKHSVFCSDGCRQKAYNKRRNARQREQTKAIKVSVEPYQRKNRYKSPISDREQEKINIEVKKKISPPFDPGRKLTPDEIQRVMPQITPIDKIPHRSRPTYTYGAAFGGER